VPTGGRKESGPSTPLGVSEQPLEARGKPVARTQQEGALGFGSLLILNELGCTRIVQEKMPKLAQARNHLAPGGRLVLSTPSPFSLLYFLYERFMYPKTCQNPEHACLVLHCDDYRAQQSPGISPVTLRFD
jgi:hypothetical protein